MAIDNSLAIRRGTLMLLKAAPGLAALVPATSIFGQTTPALPAFPFIRLGAPSTLPITGACLDGHSSVFAVHEFAKPRYQGEQIVETAEDFCHRIGAEIAAALDRRAIALDAGRATIRWTGSQVLQDPAEADCYHAVVNFRVRAITG